MTMKLSLISILALFLLVACEGANEFKESKILGGKSVDADTLNLGKTTYLEYCVQCHGVDGKGNGPAAKGLLPPPRNLTQGLYKFPWVQYGELPHDEDFARIIRQGLKGTAMLPWDISDERLNAVIQYIKTFAPEVWVGEDKVLGTKFELPADPFGPEKKVEAIAKGKKVYHVTAACTQCHRGYESKSEISNYSKELMGSAMKPDEFSPDLYQLKPQDGEYSYKVLPPDFTYHELRSVGDMESLVQRLMYGVTGSGMPGWKDVISDEEIWAVAYYIQELRELKGNTTQRYESMQKLKKQE
jgi:mono/diheme cytochrome c family protein